jgi:hypothetical protein
MEWETPSDRLREPSTQGHSWADDSSGVSDDGIVRNATKRTLGNSDDG